MTHNAKAATGSHQPHKTPDWWLVFTKFLKQGTGIAALAPSSRWLARGVVHDLDLRQAQCVVELGAGTGPITTELLRRAEDTACRVIIIERDADFCQRLRSRFPNADIVQADANDLDQLLAKRNIGQVDHIVSGLPLPSFPAPLRDRLLEIVGRRLRPEGSFRQLTHMPWVYFPLYKRYFGDVLFRLVPINFPPGGVYVCRSWKGVPARAEGKE
ncbi:MAG: class I SAM-dependent methyltransferase [Gemmataceae bacterium]